MITEGSFPREIHNEKGWRRFYEEHIIKKDDTELLEWLESSTGYCLVSDDNGHWACVCDGIQNVPMGEDTEDIATSFWIEKDKWKNTIREAILSAMEE